MKNLTDKMAPQTFLTNCIFTPIAGKQIFEDVDVPLAYGEQVVRAFFEGWAAAKGETLAKVSMCVYNSGAQKFNSIYETPVLKWYRDCEGKLYFNRDKM